MLTFALGLLGAFVVAQTEIDVRTVAITGTLLAVGAFASYVWKESPTGTLRWDGQQWLWSGFDAHRPCRLALLLDFQRLVVVLVVAGDGRRVTWLWLEAGRDNPAWMPLRRAMVARQTDVSGDRELADSVEQARVS